MNTRTLDGHNLRHQALIEVVFDNCTNEGCSVKHLCERCAALMGVGLDRVEVPASYLTDNLRDKDHVASYLSAAGVGAT